jgi:predicted  nucleic acid-binding Zn-ribbon protein
MSLSFNFTRCDVRCVNTPSTFVLGLQVLLVGCGDLGQNVNQVFLVGCGDLVQNVNQVLLVGCGELGHNVNQVLLVGC